METKRMEMLSLLTTVLQRRVSLTNTTRSIDVALRNMMSTEMNKRI